MEADEQRELERGVRAMYEAYRRGGEAKATASRQSVSAAMDAVYRADGDERDVEGLRASGLCGAYNPVAARKALALTSKVHAAGTLVVTDGERDVALLFTPNGVRALAAGLRFSSLARRLVEKGHVRAEDLARLEASLTRNRSEQEALLAIGINPDAVADAASDVVVNAVLDALWWREPTFEAAAGEADNAVRERRDVDAITLNARTTKAFTQALHERLVELTAVKRAVPSLYVALSVGSRADAVRASLPERAGEVLSVVTQQRGVLAADLPERLVKAGFVRLPLNHVARQVQELQAASAVTLAPAPPPALDRTRKPEEGLSEVARRLWLAQMLQAANASVAAARHLSSAGMHLLGRGRTADAARCLRAAYALDAHDLEAHDGCVRALLARGSREDARPLAESLARRYLDARLPGRARRLLLARLQEREETPLLLLLLEAHMALGDARAVEETAEKAVQRLRQDKRPAEAQRLADATADLAADEAGRERILSAAGAVSSRSPRARRAAVVFLAAMGLALAGAAYSLRARSAYALSVARAREALQHDPLAFEQVQARFTAMAGGVGAVAQAARGVAERAGNHLADREAFLQVRAAVEARDVDEVARVCEGLRPRTPGLTQLVAELTAHASRRSAEALDAGGELAALLAADKRQEAFACARRLVAAYGDVPGVLRKLAVPLRITSNKGAVLRWNHTSLSQPMPFPAQVPLLEERSFEVSLAGHVPEERTVSLATLSGPELHVPLLPEGGAAWLRDGGGLGEAAGVTFAGAAPRRLDVLQVPLGWRATLDAMHEAREGRLYLVALVLTLEEPKGGAFARLPQVTVRLPTPVLREPDPARVVPPLDRSPGAMDQVRAMGQRAISDALRARGSAP